MSELSGYDGACTKTSAHILRKTPTHSFTMWHYQRFWQAFMQPVSDLRQQDQAGLEQKYFIAKIAQPQLCGNPANNNAFDRKSTMKMPTISYLLCSNRNYRRYRPINKPYSSPSLPRTLYCRLPEYQPLRQSTTATRSTGIRNKKHCSDQASLHLSTPTGAEAALFLQAYSLHQGPLCFTKPVEAYVRPSSIDSSGSQGRSRRRS